MADRSSRPHRSSTKTSPQAGAANRRLRWRKRLGPVQIAGSSTCRPRPCTRCWSGVGSTGCRTSTGSPVNRYAATNTLIPASLIHVDVTKFANIPDGGGQQVTSSRQPRQAQCSQRPHRRNRRTRRSPRHADRHSVRAHRHRRPLPRRLRRDLHRRDRPPPPSASCSARSPGSPSAASPSNGSCPTTDRPTGPHAWRDACAELDITPRSAPAPTGPRPTARSNDSTAPWPTAGPTPGSTNQPNNATPPYRAGCTSTITTEPIPPSEAPPSPTDNLPGHHTSPPRSTRNTAETSAIRG